MQFLGFRVLIKRIKAIRFMMADRTVPRRKKALIIAGIVYLFLPIDIIPPLIFPFGILDDIIVWALILWYLSSELDKYWIGEKPKDYSRKFRGKNVVDDVEYDVDEADGPDRESGEADSGTGDADSDADSGTGGEAGTDEAAGGEADGTGDEAGADDGAGSETDGAGGPAGSGEEAGDVSADREKERDHRDA